MNCLKWLVGTLHRWGIDLCWSTSSQLFSIQFTIIELRIYFFFDLASSCPLFNLSKLSLRWSHCHSVRELSYAWALRTKGCSIYSKTKSSMPIVNHPQSCSFLAILALLCLLHFTGKLDIMAFVFDHDFQFRPTQYIEENRLNHRWVYHASLSELMYSSYMVMTSSVSRKDRALNCFIHIENSSSFW